MPSPLSIGLVAVALVAGSCSGAGEGDNPTSPTTTIAPPPTVVATTAAPTTALAPTTSAPTTTIDPIEAEKAAVAAAAVQARAASTAAYRSPNDPAAIAALGLSFTPDGEARAVIDSDLVVLAEQGWEVRPNPEVADSLTVEAVELIADASPARASVLNCVIDPDSVVEPTAGLNGEDTVVNDDVFAYRGTFEMVKIGDRWLVSEILLIDEWTGVLACPPA